MRCGMDSLTLKVRHRKRVPGLQRQISRRCAPS